MKKVFILVTIFCLAICAYTENVQHRTISVNLYPLGAGPSNPHNLLRFSRSGYVYYYETVIRRHPHARESSPQRVTTIGRYYIDNNVAHITWDNGFQETAQISYDLRGKVVCYFRRLTLYEH